MLKCSNIPNYQNMPHRGKCPNTLKSKYVLVSKIYPSGQNILTPPYGILFIEYAFCWKNSVQKPYLKNLFF